MKNIIFKEALDIVLDRRLYILLILVVISTTFCGVISSNNFEDINKSSINLIEAYESSLQDDCDNSLQSVAFEDHLAMVKPSNFTFLIGSNIIKNPSYSYILLPNVFFSKRLAIYYPSRIANNEISFSKFIKFDLLFIIQTIFSLMVVIMAHNSISSEKENKTISLILSNSISRQNLLIGKVSALFLIFMFVLLITIVFQLIVILIINKIPLGAYDIINLIPFFIISLVYISLWIALSVYISIKANNSSISLIFLLIIWITFIFIIPSISILLKNQFHTLPPSNEAIAEQYKALETEMWEKAHQNGGGWRGGNLRANMQDDHIMERNLAPIYNEYLDKFNNYQYYVARSRVDQLKSIYSFSSISPSFLYKRIVEHLYNSGLDFYYTFLENLQIFRRVLKNKIEQLDNNDKESFHLSFLPNYMSYKKVDKNEIPRFTMKENHALDKTNKCNFFILILLFEVIIVLFLCIIAIVKFDPR